MNDIILGESIINYYLIYAYIDAIQETISLIRAGKISQADTVSLARVLAEVDHALYELNQ